MSSERQIALLQVITLVKKNQDAIKEVMQDRRIFGLNDNRIQVIEGFYFIINFDLSNEEDISSLDYLDEFNVHNGTNPREYYYEDTKKIDTHILLNKFKSWFAVHAKEIRIMVKKMKDPAFVRRTQLKITIPSPTYASPSSTTSPTDAYPAIFSREPSPIIRGQKSVRLPNPITDHLECYFNNNSNEVNDEISKLFEMDGKYNDVNGIKFFKNTDSVYEKQSNKVKEFTKRCENGLCENIPSLYVEKSMNRSQLLLCLVRRETGKRGARILGFSTLAMKPSGILNIDLICASTEMKGGGTNLMKGVKEIGRMIKCRSIILESVNEQNTINFYLKESFKFTGMTKKDKEARHCNENNDFEHEEDDDPTDGDLCMMKYEFSGGRKKTMKRRTKTMKRRTNSNKKK